MPAAPTLTLGLPLDDARTPGRRWRRRRDLTIALAHGAGASCRLLAEVFDLSPSRVKEIVARLDGESLAKSERPDFEESPAFPAVRRSPKRRKSAHLVRP